MTFDPSKRTQRMQAGKSIEYWFTCLDWMRGARTRYMKAFCGTAYGRQLGFGRVSPKQMLALLQKTGQAYSILLAYHCPKYRMTSKTPEGKGFAKRWATSLNKRVEQIQLDKTLRLCAIDAFFLMSIMKTYRGERPVDRVSPDNFVWDAGLGDMRRSPFFADRYRVPLEWCRKNQLMDQKIVDTWKPVRRSEKNQNSNESWQLTEGGDSDEGEFTEMVELGDVFFADTSHVGTWPVSGNFELDMEQKPAMWLPWRENEFGCYRTCTFIDCPDNAVPISPSAGVYDMGCFVNVLLKKVAFRAANQKDTICYPPGGDTDARKLKDAGEIQTLMMKDPNSVQVKKLLGVDQPLWSLLLSMLTLYKQASDTTIGNDPFADTLGQEQDINERVQRREGEFKKKWAQFLSEIGEDVADDMYDNPDLSIEARRKLGSTEFSVDASWHPPDAMDEFGNPKLERVGPIDRFEVKVIPSSTEYRSSQQLLDSRMQKLGALAPYIPIGMQQGTSLNFRKLVESMSELDDDDEFESLWDYNGLPMDQAEGDGEQASFDGSKPNGEYTRTNVTQGGGGGRLQMLAAQMTQPQPAMVSQ